MNSEQKIQHECVKWFDFEYPQYRGLLWHNYLNPPNKIQGGILVGLGLKKGLPDLTFALPIKSRHGLYIELKTETGKLAKEQIRYKELLQKVGYSWELCRSLEQFKKIITNYLETP